MKKILTLAAFALLTNTSLGQAVKFDPLTGTPEEYGNKTKKLMIKLGDPKLSPKSIKAIQEQLSALVKFAGFKFHPEQIKGIEAVHMLNAYRQYIDTTIEIFQEKYNKEKWFNIEKYLDVDDIDDLIRAHYGLKGKNMGEPDKNLKALLDRLNTIQDEENESAEREKRNPTNYLFLLKDPLGILKIDQANLAITKATMKIWILDFPEDRITKAFTEADAKLKELQAAFQALTSAFMKIKEEDKALFNEKVSSIVDRFQKMAPFYLLPIPTDKVSIEATEITFKQGIKVTEPDGKLTPGSLLLKPCKNEDIFRLIFSDALFLKTAPGTGNSSYKSDPIPVNDLTDITLKYKVNLYQGKGGVGFGFQSEGKWIAQKSYSYTEKNEGEVEDEIKLPTTTKGNITLVIYNNRTPAERSMIAFEHLTLTANRKKE